MNIDIPSLNLIVLAPQFVIIVAALVVLLADLFRGQEQKNLPAWLSLAGVIFSAVVLFATWGGEASSFQKMAAADGYSQFLNLIFLTTAGLSILISIKYIADEGLACGEYYALLLLATAGMMLMGAATDLIIVFLALEILSIPLYVLTGLNRARLESGEAALKYFLLGAFASGFFLYGIALTYGATGTTNLAGIVGFLGSANPALSVVEGAGPYLTIALGLLLIGFAFKVALVPFHTWVPDVYQGAPTSVTAFMSVGAKAAGFAALARVLLYAFPTLASGWTVPLAALAVLTMTLGNLAAIAQTDIKRMLAYSSIAHAGYILMGVVAANEAGVAGILFYLLAYALMNVGAFATAIVVGPALSPSKGKRGEPGVEIADYAGLASRRPFLAAAMAVFMLSLAGVPPLAGFMGKFYLFSAAVQADLTWLALVGVLNSVLSAFFYLRVIVVMYMKEAEEPKPLSLSWPLGIAIALAALGTLALGLWPSPLLDMARQAIRALLGS